MDNKIKIGIGTLAIIAIISLSSIYNTLKVSSVSQQAAISNATILPTPELDSDHDGLPDTEESIWNTDPNNPDTDGDGYKDGEEVASGHNPTIAGPNDVLFDTTKQNVTQKIGSLALSGLSQGQISASNPDATTLNALSNETILQAKINFAGPEPEVMLLPESADSQNNYLNKLKPILDEIREREPGGLITLLQAYQNVTTPSQLDNDQIKAVADQQISILDAHLQQLGNIAAPKKYLEAQKDLMRLLQESHGAYLALKNIQSDPLQGIVGLSTLMDDLTTNLADCLKPFTQ